MAHIKTLFEKLAVPSISFRRLIQHIYANPINGHANRQTDYSTSICVLHNEIIRLEATVEIRKWIEFYCSTGLVTRHEYYEKLLERPNRAPRSESSRLPPMKTLPPPPNRLQNRQVLV